MPEIKHHPIVSSNIESAGYDDSTKTLEVKFKSGGIYRYPGVPRIIYEGIFKAESPGGFVQRWIVRGKYDYKKVNK